MVKNEAGLVAIKHHTSNPSRPIQIGDVIYQSTPQHNISLMWVNESDVESILSLKTHGCNCGGGVSKPLFHLANELDICLWETGDRCK
jgi:hypothetical protein